MSTKKAFVLINLSSLIKKYGKDFPKALACNDEREVRMTITPEDVPTLLETARVNRAINKDSVSRLARSQVLGTFDTTMHQNTICFDTQGKFSNGNHRVSAQVISENTYTYKCYLGVNEEHVKNLVDHPTGRVRTNADRFHAYNDDPVVSKIVQGKNGRAKLMDGAVNSLYNSFTGEKRPDISDSLKIIRHYREEFLYVVDNLGSNRLLRRASVMNAAVLAYRYAKKNGCMDVFVDAIDSIRTAADLEGTTLTLYKYLETLSRRTARGKAVVADCQWVILTKTMRAFQAILLQQPITVLQITRKGERSKDLRTWFIEGDSNLQAKRLKLTPVRSVLNRGKK